MYNYLRSTVIPNRRRDSEAKKLEVQVRLWFFIMGVLVGILIVRDF